MSLDVPMNNFAEKNKMLPIFEQMSLEDQQSFVSEFEALLRTNTMVDGERRPHTLEIIIALSECRISMGLTHDEEGQPLINWEDPAALLTDTKYWKIRQLITTNYPTGRRSVDLGDYWGEQEMEIPVNMYGATISDETAAAVLHRLWRHRKYMAVANDNAWKLLQNLINCEGLTEYDDFYKAAAALQNMKTTIALRKTNEANESKTQFAENCNRLVITTSDVHRLMRKFIQQRNIHSNGGAFNVNPGITHELLQKVYEGLQVAVSSQTLPGHINPTIYAKMIAEIQEHALNEQINFDPHFPAEKALRGTLNKYVRNFSFQMMRKGRMEACRAKPLIIQDMAFATDAQRQPMTDSTNKKQQPWQGRRRQGFQGKQQDGRENKPVAHVAQPSSDNQPASGYFCCLRAVPVSSKYGSAAKINPPGPVAKSTGTKGGPGVSSDSQDWPR